MIGKASRLWMSFAALSTSANLACAGGAPNPPASPCPPPSLPGVMQGVVGYSRTTCDQKPPCGCAVFEIYLEAIALENRDGVRSGGLRHLLETTQESQRIAIQSQAGVFQHVLPAGEYAVIWKNDSLAEFGVPPVNTSSGAMIRSALLLTQPALKQVLLIAHAGDPGVFFNLSAEGEGSNPETPPW